MEFLKRHYEKLILLFLLVAFIISMIHVLRIIQQTREVTEESLQIPSRKADYEPKDPKAADFDVAARFQKTGLTWRPSVAREKGNEEHFSDLVIPFAMARCPHCSKIIPRSYFQGGPEANKERKEGQKEIPPGKCPLCDGELVQPPEKKGPIWKVTAEDADGDGMSDVDEGKYGFDKTNPHDGCMDKDGDGFSNVYEIKMGTNPTDPRSRPPLWYRLKLSALRRVELPITFRALNANNSDDKQKWDIQLNTKDDRGRERTQIEMLGSIITLDKKEYKIYDILRKQTEVPGLTKDGTKLIKDESVIYLEQCDGNGKDKLEMQVGQKVYSSNPKAILIDTGMKDKVYICDIREVFTMGSRAIGTTRYRLKSIDPKKMTAQLEDPTKFEGDTTLDPAGTSMLVTKDGQIPEEMLVRHDVVEPGMDEFGIGAGRRMR